MSAETSMLGGRSRHAQSVPRAWRAAISLVLVCAIGTLGFHAIEPDWTLGKSFYFTLITITTVGYGDEGLSEAGKNFAAIVLIFGIAVASYSFAVLMQFTVDREIHRRRRMKAQISKLRDHVIVCGFGRMGQTVCEELLAQGASVVVIDLSDERIADATEMGCSVIQGNGAEDDVLVSAGLEHARVLVTAVDAESQNIVIALTARELSSEIEIISRAESPSDLRKLKRAGATRVVSPFHSGGLAVANMILRPKVAEFLSVAGHCANKVSLAEIIVDAESAIEGRTLSDFGSERVPNVCFVSLERDGADPVVPPRGDEVFAADDHFIVAGDPEQIASMKDAASAAIPVAR